MTVTEMRATPRMCVLYRDSIDQAGNVVGWVPVAWAVVLPGGATVTAPVHGPPAATLWHDITDARSALDAEIDEVRPRTGPVLVRDLEIRDDGDLLQVTALPPKPRTSHEERKGASVEAERS